MVFSCWFERTVLSSDLSYLWNRRYPQFIRHSSQWIRSGSSLTFSVPHICRIPPLCFIWITRSDFSLASYGESEGDHCWLVLLNFTLNYEFCFSSNGPCSYACHCDWSQVFLSFISLNLEFIWPATCQQHLIAGCKRIRLWSEWILVIISPRFVIADRTTFIDQLQVFYWCWCNGGTIKTFISSNLSLGQLIRDKVMMNWKSTRMKLSPQVYRQNPICISSFYFNYLIT